MALETVKRALLTGVGSMHVQKMTNGDLVSSSVKPTYDEKTFATPSVQKLGTALTIVDKKVYLSNQLHTLIKKITKAELTLDAGYFPEGLAEELQGMKKVGEKGAWAMPSNPKPIPFRLGVPFTDENNNSQIFNFPYCFLTPVEQSAETEGEDYNEQIKQFKIEALPLPFEVEIDGHKDKYVFHQVDLSNSASAAYYDEKKLLQQGWFDAETLDAAKK